MGTANAKAIFDADDSRVLAAAKRIDRVLLGVEAKFSKMAVFGAKLAAPFVAAGLAIGDGLKKAFEVGAEMHDLSASTGIAVEDLVVLTQEFKNAGKSGEDVGKTIAKMQKALVDGSADEKLAQMGISLDALRKQTPIEQFHTLGKAINDLPDAAERADVAMALFGKTGASLLALFSEKNFGSAAKQVGEQAEILGRDAALFHDVSEKLNLAGLKVQGFFVGMADKVAGVLIPFLDRMAGTDWAQQGQAFGDALAVPLEAIADNEFGDLLARGITIAFLTAVNKLAGGVLTAVALLGDGFIIAVSKAMSLLLSGIAEALDLMSHTPFGGRYAKEAASVRAFQADRDRKAANYTDIGTTIAQSMKAGEIFDVDMLRDQQVEAIDQLLDRAGVRQGQALAANPQTTRAGGDLSLEGAMNMSGVSALQRVGGAFGMGGGDPLLDENRRQTSILGEIRDALKGAKPLPDVASHSGLYA